MSYRHSGSKMFKAYEFVVDCAPLAICPESCPVHDPYCWRAAPKSGIASIGTMRLLDPLAIKSIMPGIKQKLLTLSVYSMITNFFGIYQANAWIRLVADSAEIFKRDVYNTGDAWRLNEFSLDKDVSMTNVLDVQFYEAASGFVIGYATLHCSQVKLDYEWYSDITPVTASVRLTVTNSKTGTLVKDAYVALMSGAVIIADGYTDGGEVTFENIDEGSYTVKVLAGGYYNFEKSIEVAPPSVWYTAKIVPIPVTPIPSWLWYAVGGVAALGAVTIIPSIIKRKPEERIVVVK